LCNSTRSLKPGMVAQGASTRYPVRANFHQGVCVR
jgi:hypothetical protein